MSRNKLSKKSAIPEYIWYISLIVISLTLVLTIVTMAKKTRKKLNIPEIKDATFTIYVDPLNKIYLEDMLIQGVNKKNLVNFYISCEDKSVNLSTLFNQNPENLFVVNSNNYLELLKKDFEINLTALNMSDKCKKEGSRWYLFYGDPKEGGVVIARAEVIRKVKFN